MKKSKGNSSPFPWWEKRRKAMENKIGFSESQYIPVGNKKDKFKASSSPVKWKEPVRDGEDAVRLSSQQEYVLDLIRQGKNVFYTGNAGTGKTTLLREIQKCAPEGTFITALTGVAAVQAGGTTLHSFAGIGLGNGTKENLYSMVLKGQKAKNWRSANVLIIDEVSMLDGKLFDKLEYIARKIRQCEKPFGGIQLVLCGDFFQLPPIQKVGETSVNYCFQSSCWGKVLDYSLELTQIYRQSDPKLIKLLNEVRYQHVSAESLDLLKYLNRPLNCTDIEPTKLYSHNKSVNDINNRKLYSLEGKEKVYYASDHGQSPYKENLSKYVIAMEKLVLKKGAQVMLLKNLTEELINGSRGVVEDFDEEGWPRVKFTDGTLRTINVVDWNLENSSGIVLARRIQVPLKLAWAITIHKSQGMSIDLLQVDLKHVFSQGQAYVALSRARTIEGLQVLTFDETRFTTSDAVIKFYREKIQKAPGQLASEASNEASPSSSTVQTTSPKDLLKTPLKRRRPEEKGDNSTRKRFRSCSSSTSPVGFHDSNANHELSYSSQESSFSSSQENSQMVSSSSSSHTPCVKRGFQKASELYSDSPSQNKEFLLPLFIEEATDEECLLASPTPSCELVVKRKRPTQSKSFDNLIHHPKKDKFTSSSIIGLTANGGQDASSWNTCSDGPSWNPDSGGKQKRPLTSSTKAYQKVNKSNAKSDRRGSRAAKAVPPHTSSAENDKGSSKFEAKVKRQREKSKRKSSILFDALKSGESKDAQEQEISGPSVENQTASFERRNESKHVTETSTNNAQTNKDLRRTDLQMMIDKDLSNETAISCKEDIYLNTDDKFDTSATATGDVSESPSTNESCFSLAEHQLSSSSIEVACERSREKSKIHCSKLFEALKEDGDGELSDTGWGVCERQQLDASLVPYYADKNLELDCSVHRSASIKLHRLCENISKEASFGPEGMKSVTYAGYSTNTLRKTKMDNDFKLAASGMDKGTQSKDSVTQTEFRGEEVSIQTDSFPKHPCSGCLNVQKEGSSDNPDNSSSRRYSANSLDLYPFSQADTCPRNHSFSNSCDLEGMYFEFRIPSMSFVIAELNKMMSIMLSLAVVMCGLFIQIFCRQLDD